MTGFGVDTEWGRLRRAAVARDEVAALLACAGVEVERGPLSSIVVGTRSISVNPRPPGEVDGAFIEAGDVLRNGTQIYAGMSGQASNMAGIDALEARLGAAYRVIPMALRSSVRHLADVLALPRLGLVIQCRSLLIDGLPTALRDWDSIDLTAEEGARGAADVLAIDQDRVVVCAAEVRLIDELRRRGLEVFPMALGSGLRRAHCALWRE